MAARKMADLALGSWEASQVLGIHFTQPKRMADKGLLTIRQLHSPEVTDPERVFSVYSLDECQKDWDDYEEQLKHGGSGRRPRANVDDRPAMLKLLKALEHPIEFGDAVSTGEAAEILRCHWTWPSRLAAEGKIIGRILQNGRNARSRCWIFSRASCEANVSVTTRMEEAGTKKGRKRKQA
jgi:hypothetical protein